MRSKVRAGYVSGWPAKLLKTTGVTWGFLSDESHQEGWEHHVVQSLGKTWGICAGDDWQGRSHPGQQNLVGGPIFEANQDSSSYIHHGNPRDPLLLHSLGWWMEKNKLCDTYRLRETYRLGPTMLGILKKLAKFK